MRLLCMLFDHWWLYAFQTFDSEARTYTIVECKRCGCIAIGKRGR